MRFRRVEATPQESPVPESAAGSVLELRRDGKLLKLLGKRESDG